MTAQWSLVNLTVGTGPIVDMNGVPIANPAGESIVAAAGASTNIPHWMDAPLATGWVRFARSLLNQARAASSYAGWGFMAACANAIAQSYNATNVQWLTDPEARALYRRFIAGPPSVPGGGGAATAEFGPFDYNPTFSVHNRSWLQTGGSTGDRTLKGVIPARARRVFESCMTDPPNANKHESQFIPHFNFYVNVASNLSFNYDPMNQLGAATTPQNAHDDQNYSLSAIPYPSLLDNCLMGLGVYALRPGVECPRREIHTLQFQRTRSCEARASGDIYKWDTYQFDSNWTLVSAGSGSTLGAPQLCTGSIDDYVPWFDQWISSLERRGPQRVARDSRIYTAYLNSETLAIFASGAPAGYLSAIVGTATQIAQHDPVVGRDLQAIGALGAAIAGGFGAALAGPTAGLSIGVAALVAGAVVAITSVLSAVAVPPGYAGLYMDDLRRPKPVYERGYLSGNPADQTSAGAPITLIEDPPGFVRPVTPTTTRTITGSAVGRNILNAPGLTRLAPTNTQAAPPAQLPSSTLAGIPTWALVTGGLVVAGGIGYFVYRGTSRRR